MTVNYNAGPEKCLEVLFLTLKEMGVFDDSLQIVYADFIEEFHSYLTGNLFLKLYLRDKREFLAEHSSLLELSDARVNLSYYRLKDGEHDVIKISGKR